MQKHIHIISRAKAKELGMPKYFTGKPCKHGHIAERRSLNGECFTCRREYLDMWRLENPDKDSGYRRAWYVENRDKCIESKRIWRMENKEHSAEYCREWRKSNPNRCRAIYAKRRSLTRGGASSDEVSKWCDSQEKSCFYCRVDCEYDYHIDHYVPLSKGGEHEVYNLRISCPSCNVRKHNIMPEEFMKRS